ncbi:MAG: ThiF family adenylyltransferase [Rhodobacteraceae bacterium]|nr:ThiF family adenylyltransferase [Paracoccaceae bacterium]
MKSLTLAMTRRLHTEAFQYLFPGDGLEAAGIFICNQGTGTHHQRLVVTEFVAVPHELSDRRTGLVVWPFEAHFDPQRIARIDRERQSIMTIHSHPGGGTGFSRIDDRNDRELFASVNAWFDDGRFNGSAIMVPDGVVVARAVTEEGQFRPFRSVNVVGETISIWNTEEGHFSTAYETKMRQTLGRGTLERLRKMRVGVVGCSGTGSIIIELLARNCIGTLVLVDDDVVEEKNLNRLVNSTLADAQDGKPKVHALAAAINRAGLGTHVDAHNALTDSPDVLGALIDCDAIFGCVDSAFGRYHLDCLASAYLIPYFDVGVHLDADGTGNIRAADAVAHYIHPEGRDLLSRGAYDLNQVRAETYQRTDPDTYARHQAAGYLVSVGEEQPAVMSVNMQAACMAFNDFLARVHAFRWDPDCEFATQRFQLTHGCYERETDDGAPCPLFKKYQGMGDSSILVQSNLCHD